MSTYADLFVVVGFRVDSEKSVYYRKCTNIDELKNAVAVAFTTKECDFISVRRVRRDEGSSV